MASKIVLEGLNERKVAKFIASHPNFHLILDNDMFMLYSKKAPDWETATEKEYNAWEKSVKSITVYDTPAALFPMFVTMLGGTCASV